ncbi:MAG: AAA family ATPase [Elusimicrobiales bacterium]|nr:AAA family ATPase [Elusimicrobiales bacterium]
MESIVFFGKGGVGKSTIASNVTVVLARGGRKVLHIGCDPKMDSTLALMGRHISPYADKAGGEGGGRLRDSVFESPVAGVHCVEAGGPEPGVGCAGLGIGSMLDAIRDEGLLEKGGYGASVFDVLGDVVCGGFAAPLRRGFARKVVIVTSETMLSLYAANRLIKMIENYSRNGVYLAGLAVNALRPEGVRAAESFAEAVGTRVLGVTLRDPAVAAAERTHRPAVLADPKSDFARRIVLLCSAIKAAGRPAAPARALTESGFYSFMKGGAASGPAAGKSSRRRGSAPRPEALIESAGFRLAGMEGGQLLLDWRSSRGVLRTVMAPAVSSRGGAPGFSDWTVCFHPSAGPDSEAAGGELLESASRLSGLTFEEVSAVFAAAPGAAASQIPGAPAGARQHLGFGRWPRFIFAGSEVDSLAPPDSVMAMHGDNECRFCICEGGALGAFSENACVRPGGADMPGPVLPRSDEREPSTDLRAAEAIFGDDDKMLSAMRAAAAQAGPGGLAEFYVGCSPLLLASDAEAVARRVREETGVSLSLERYCSLGKYSPEKAARRAGFMAGKFRRASRKPARDVNLVYYGECPPALRALLNDRGISAEEPGEDFYAGSAAAGLQVLSAPDPVLQSALDQAGLRWLLPPAPYGLAGTSAWLAAIAAALGRGEADTAPSGEQLAEAARLRRLSAGKAAAFVLPAGETGRLAGGAAFKRVPVPAVLSEGGFVPRFFVLAASEGERRAAAAGLKAALPGLRFAPPVLFSSPAGLRRLLRADRAVRLVYSDVRSDGRVAAAGKTPFSAGIFEPGFDGALETWRRLLELCDWDFNERYIAR